MKKELSFTVTGRQEGLPVKRILADELGLSRREISRLKFTAGIRCNNEQVRITQEVHAGDVISLVFPEKDAAHAVRLGGVPEILYEDDDLVIVNKPAGMPSHASHMHLDDDMGTLLANYYGKGFTVRAIGRLDKDVSGLMVYAKNQPAAARLSAMRSDDALRKTYTALVHGSFAEESGELRHTLKKQEGQRARIVNEGGAECVTCYRVIRQGKDWAYLAITLKTGRSHQIRAGMAWYGHPLYGDTLYGGGRSLSRPALHCMRLELKQPFTGKHIVCEAPLTEDMEDLLKKLEQGEESNAV